MEPRMSVAITLPTLRDLLTYHLEHESELDPSDLPDLAIREWLERQRDPRKRSGPEGYLGKMVLIPDGARLRITSQHCVHYAAIVGDELIYNGLSMSPNQFATASLGTVRNAWAAIYIQLPGERDWKPAVRLRYAAAAQAQRLANQAGRGTPRPSLGGKC